MLEQQSQLLRTQQQLATGKRLLSPADDPTATVKIVGLDQTLKVTEQFQKNINSARSRLELEESVIAGVTNALDRVRELAVQANNTSLTNEDRQSLAIVVRQRLDELLALSNSQNAGGEYLFSGYQGNTQPFTATATGSYVYNGDDGQRFLQVGPNRQIAVTDSGTSAFREIRNGNGTFTTFDNQSNTGGGIIDPGSVSNQALIDGDSYDLTFFSATSATATLAFNDVIGTDDDLTYTLQINGVNAYTTSQNAVAPAPASTLSELAAGINLNTGATGVRAYVDSGTLYLAPTTPTSTPMTISETMGGFTATDGDTMTGYFGSALTEVAPVGANIVLDTAADFYLVEDSSNNVETSGLYTEGGSIAFNGIQTNVKGVPNVGDQFTINPSLNQDVFNTVRNLAVALETSGGNTPDDMARLNNGINRFLSDVDRAMDNFRSIRAQVGSRLSALDTQAGLNENFTLQIKTTLSELQDLDYAEAITRLNQQQVALEAAQQSFIRIQGLSLFNFL